VGVDGEAAELYLRARLDPVSVSLHKSPWNLPQHRFGDRQGLADLGDVVDTEDGGAVGGGDHRGGDAAAEAVAGGGAVEAADEALARGADDQWPAERRQLPQPAQQ